jgi:hypothetical protein
MESLKSGEICGNQPEICDNNNDPQRSTNDPQMTHNEPLPMTMTQNEPLPMTMTQNEPLPMTMTQTGLPLSIHSTSTSILTPTLQANTDIHSTDQPTPLRRRDTLPPIFRAGSVKPGKLINGKTTKLIETGEELLIPSPVSNPSMTSKKSKSKSKKTDIMITKPRTMTSGGKIKGRPRGATNVANRRADIIGLSKIIQVVTGESVEQLVANHLANARTRYNDGTDTRSYTTLISTLIDKCFIPLAKTVEVNVTGTVSHVAKSLSEQDELITQRLQNYGKIYGVEYIEVDVDDGEE